jgi:hypothetical protein
VGVVLLLVALELFYDTDVDGIAAVASVST